MKHPTSNAQRFVCWRKPYLTRAPKFPNSTLADLYDVDVMPHQLRKAHQELDRAVDKLYRPAPFTGDRDRVEHLFGLYEKLVAPLAATAPKPRRRRSKRIV